MEEADMVCVTQSMFDFADYGRNEEGVSKKD